MNKISSWKKPMGEPRLRLLEPGHCVLLILGPLDMKGLLGAATVIGSLMYGAGHVFKGQANFYMHGGSFRNSTSDAEFGHLLGATALLHRTFHLLLLRRPAR